MAAEEHVVTVPDTIHPWPLAFEVADATPAGSWALVGGLMVHVHALRAGVNPSRPTTDVDLLLSMGTRTVSEVVGPLQSLGFEPVEPSGGAPFSRFHRNKDRVDVMVPPRSVRARWLHRQIMDVPAAQQALDRSDTYTLVGDDRTAQISVPDSLAALVVKAAAYEIDQRDRGRHLEDLAVLFASCDGFAGLDAGRLTASERRHLRVAIGQLSDTGHVAWAVLDEFNRAFA